MRDTAATRIPAQATIATLRDAAADCRACELWREGTQTVFGEGPAGARIVAVGEQPGDTEDLDGHPFVGPAGRVFDDALERAGIDRADVYLTNAVKHFHHEQRGKKRIHRKPDLGHIRACEPWLGAELAVVSPALAIAMGATAARALLGRPVRVLAERGQIAEPLEGATGTDHGAPLVDPAGTGRPGTPDGRVRAGPPRGRRGDRLARNASRCRSFGGASFTGCPARAYAARHDIADRYA